MELPGIDTHKLSIFQSMIEQCDSVMVHFDPRVNWVVVPERLKGESKLILRISMRDYYPSLEDKEMGISATLTFGGTPYDCFIPFDAVYAMSDMNGKIGASVWTSDIPQNLIPPTLSGEIKENPVVKLPPKLTLIQGGGQTTPPRRGHLSLVKNEA